MFWGTVHRMILVELVKVFFIALVALTGLILIAGIISEAMKNGFGPAQIAIIIPLLLPSLLPYTVPTTTLFATCIVYGRLSADNEILALKAAGVHIVHVVWPAIFLGLVTSVVTMVCYLDIIPRTGFAMRTNVIGDVEELLYNMLRKDGHIKHGSINVEIHVKSMSGRKLHDVVFKRKAPDGNGFDVIAVAREAELRVDLAHKKILVDMRKCQVNGGNGVVESKIWDVELPNEFLGTTVKFRAMDMTWAELNEYQERIERELEKDIVDANLLQAADNLGAVRPENAERRRHLDNERKYREGMLCSIMAERHMRPALALGCLCFALVGCPVGIWFSKSDFLSAFITCFLPIVILYYPLLLCMFNMARAGRISPWLSIYDADTIVLLIGGFLFNRLARN